MGHKCCLTVVSVATFLTAAMSIITTTAAAHPIIPLKDAHKLRSSYSIYLSSLSCLFYRALPHCAVDGQAGLLCFVGWRLPRFAGGDPPSDAINGTGGDCAPRCDGFSRSNSHGKDTFIMCLVCVYALTLSLSRFLERIIVSPKWTRESLSARRGTVGAFSFPLSSCKALSFEKALSRSTPLAVRQVF